MKTACSSQKHPSVLLFESWRSPSKRAFHKAKSIYKRAIKDEINSFYVSEYEICKQLPRCIPLMHPQSNEILSAQRSREHMQRSAGKTCAPSLERGSKVVKCWEALGNQSKRKKQLKVPPWSWLGSSHTGSGLVKALGNQGPINFNRRHIVQNNKYFSQQSVSWRVCEGIYAKFMHGSQNGMELSSLHIFLFIWGFSKSCRDIFHNKTFTVQFTAQYFTFTFTMGSPLTYLSVRWKA